MTEQVTDTTLIISLKKVDYIDVREISELIADLYSREGTFGADDFIVSKVEFHGHFKKRVVIY